jgi:hypothetical protein
MMTPELNKDNNLSFNLEETDSIKKYSYWTNIISLICKISGIIVMILGIPMLFAFGFGLVYIGLGFLTYKFGTWFKSSSDAVKFLPDSKSPEELKASLFNIINPLAKINKIQAILTFVMIAIYILLTILIISYFYSSASLLNGYPTQYKTSPY